MKQKDLFGNEIIVREDPIGKGRLAELQHAELIKIHGIKDKRTCKGCKFLMVNRFAKVYFKCAKAHVSGSEATDCRNGWQACGLYEESKKVL